MYLQSGGIGAVAVLGEDEIPDLEGLQALAVESLARYKLTDELHIIDVLPRNPAGEIQKFELKEQFIAECH